MIITFLLICFSIFFLVSSLVRILLSVVIRRAQKREANRYQQGYSAGEHQTHKKEGEVYVSSPAPESQDKVVEKDMGEYVDFETVKEDK